MVDGNVSFKNVTDKTDGYNLDYCPQLSLSDNNYIANYSLIAVNIFCLLVNCFHVLVLSQLKVLNRDSYRSVLYHISIADMCNSVAMSVRIFVKDYRVFTEQPVEFTIFYDVVLDSAVFLRYNILAGASVERFIAVCRPLSYGSSWYINNIHNSLAVFWFYTFAAVTARSIIFWDKYCISGFLGPTNILSFWPTIMAACSAGPPLLITLMMMVLVCVEIAKMSRRSNTDQEKVIYSAAKYLIIIIIMFYVFLLVPILNYILAMTDTFFFGVGYMEYSLYSVYGILNTVIYGWMHVNYRGVIRQFMVGTLDKLASLTRSKVEPSSGPAGGGPSPSISQENREKVIELEEKRDIEDGELGRIVNEKEPAMNTSEQEAAVEELG